MAGRPVRRTTPPITHHRSPISFQSHSSPVDMPYTKRFGVCVLIRDASCIPIRYLFLASVSRNFVICGLLAHGLLGRLSRLAYVGHGTVPSPRSIHECFSPLHRSLVRLARLTSNDSPATSLDCKYPSIITGSCDRPECFTIPAGAVHPVVLPTAYARLSSIGQFQHPANNSFRVRMVFSRAARYDSSRSVPLFLRKRMTRSSRS